MEFIQASNAENKKGTVSASTFGNHSEAWETPSRKQQSNADNRENCWLYSEDDHTLSAVENAGLGLMEHLVLPNCHLISKQAIPEMYKQVSNFLSECLESIPTLNLTIDIGISDVCPSSFLSLTTQLTDSSFTFTL